MLLCCVLLSVCEEATTMALCQDQWKHTQREAKAKIVLFIFVLCTAKSSCIHAISTSSLMAGAKLPPYGQFLLILICGRGRLTGSHMCEQKARIKFAWAEFPTLFRPPPILPLAVFEVSGIFSPKCVIVGMLKLIMVFGWLRICIRLLGYSQLIHPTLSYGWYHHIPMKSAKNVTFMTWGIEESARIWYW